MAKITLQHGDLTAVIGDNDADKASGHRAGYNGVWSLRHRTGTRSVFVPRIAGLNLEHIISGEGEAEKDVFFEPRRSPMALKSLSETAVELHQPPTASTFLESWTRFELVAPHHLDMHFRCRATQHAFPHDYIGLFWASYINAPDDKSLYFRGGLEEAKTTGHWQQICTPAHDRDSTVRHRGDKFDMAFVPNVGRGRVAFGGGIHDAAAIAMGTRSLAGNWRLATSGIQARHRRDSERQEPPRHRLRRAKVRHGRQHSHSPSFLNERLNCP